MHLLRWMKLFEIQESWGHLKFSSSPAFCKFDQLHFIVYIILATILGNSSVQKDTLVISQLHCSKRDTNIILKDPLIMTHSTSVQCTVHFFSTRVEMNKRLVTYGQFGILYDFIIPPIWIVQLSWAESSMKAWIFSESSS